MNLLADVARCYGQGEPICVTCARRKQIERDERLMQAGHHFYWLAYMQGEPQPDYCLDYIEDQP